MHVSGYNLYFSDMEDNKWVVNHTAIDKVLPSTPVYTFPCISKGCM